MTHETPPIAQLIDLTGKVAIVTGGGKGIGQGIAFRLAEAGAHVIVANLGMEAARETAAMITARGQKATAIETDVSDAASVANMVAAAEALGGADVLVNNAGIYPNIPLLELSETDFERIVDVNLKGVFLCTKAVSASLIARGKSGRIINITSIDALHPSAVGYATYDATKHGVLGFTKNTALELAPHRIWVNAIAPGGINTPGTGVGTLSDEQLDEATKAFRSKIPMRRMGEPDDIARAALFLASDLSSYMTGSQVVVDGGVLLA